MKVVTYVNNNYRDDMEYFDLRNTYNKYGGLIRAYYVFNRDDEHIFFGIYADNLHFVGRKHFIKSMRMANFTYKQGKFYGNLGEFNQDQLICFFQCINAEWIVPEIRHSNVYKHLKAKTVMKAIITGKITNPEMLYKFILKNSFHAHGIIPWRLFAEYLRRPYVSLQDIIDFTKNPAESLNAVLNPGNYGNIDLSLYQDVLKYAALLDEVVDLTWSARRLREEHQRQIREVALMEITSKDETPIYSEKAMEGIFPEYCKLINTEAEAYSEGMAMDNCIYSYWGRMRQGQYLAVHFDIDGGCLLGMTVSHYDKTVYYQQCYQSHNRAITAHQRLIVEAFVQYHAKDLYEMLNTNFYNKVTNEAVAEAIPALGF